MMMMKMMMLEFKMIVDDSTILSKRKEKNYILLHIEVDVSD